MESITSTQVYEKNGFTHLSIENEFIKAVFIPELGGKMSELLNKKTGKQFLLEPQTRDKNYKKPYYGASFEEFDTSGFDECFPTIEASEYPSGNGKANHMEMFFPDHGELWSRRWQYEVLENKLILTINGIQFNYSFQKEIRVEGNNLNILYTLKNLSNQEFCYIWSAHPLLQVVPGTRFIFRDRIEKVFINWASDKSIGTYGDVLPWPTLSSNDSAADFSLVPDRSTGKAVKCFIEDLKCGLIGLHHADTDESILFRFDVKEIPYLGLWLCYGGWPLNKMHKHLTVAIEPASGRPDSLKESIKRKECSVIEPGGINTWTLEISLWKGQPEMNNLSDIDIRKEILDN